MKVEKEGEEDEPWLNRKHAILSYSKLIFQICFFLTEFVTSM